MFIKRYECVKCKPFLVVISSGFAVGSLLKAFSVRCDKLLVCVGLPLSTVTSPTAATGRKDTVLCCTYDEITNAAYTLLVPSSHCLHWYARSVNVVVVFNKFRYNGHVRPGLHDTTGWTTGCMFTRRERLDIGLHESNRLNSYNRLDNRLNVCIHDTTGCTVYTNIQPVVQPVVQPV